MDSAIEKFDPASAPVTRTQGMFTYTVQTRFVDSNFANAATSPPTPQMRVEVRVQWQDNTYTSTGFVAGG